MLFAAPAAMAIANARRQREEQRARASIGSGACCSKDASRAGVWLLPEPWLKSQAQPGGHSSCALVTTLTYPVSP